MSQRNTLEARILELNSQLGISKKQFSRAQSNQDLGRLIDELEDKLAQQSGEVDEGEDAVPEDGTPEDTQEVLISGATDVPEGAEIDDSVDGPEVNSNADGDLEIEALITLQLKGKSGPILIEKGQRDFVPEKEAMSAVEDRVAVLVGRL